MNEFNNNRQFNRSGTMPGGGWSTFQPAAQASLSERTAFIRKVYALFFAGILFAIGGVVFGLSSIPLMNAIIAHPFIAFIALMAGVFGAQAVRHTPGLNLIALFAFTGVMGIFISPLIAIYTQLNPVSILQAGILTVGIFGGLTAYVFISRKDFSFMRGMMVTGLVVVVLASLLNIFLVSSAFSFAISVAALLLFSGFVLYDTSNIMRRYPTNEYIAGALSLFLDAFNIFIALLNILNSNRR